MPIIDWSATAAWIALIVAIISPVITTLLTNRHQRKIKEIEIYHAKRFEAVSAFLAAAGEAQQSPSEESFQKYCKLLGAATIYLTPEILEVAHRFEPNKSHESELVFYELTKLFAHYGSLKNVK